MSTPSMASYRRTGTSRATLKASGVLYLSAAVTAEPEWRERARGAVAREDQAALDGLALCLCDQAGADAGCRAIEQSAERRGDAHCALPLDITPREISKVKDDSARSLEAPVCPGRRD